MPALKPTAFTAEIVWLGQVAPGESGIRSTAMTDCLLTFEGMAGAVHAGTTRPSCVRTTAQHPKGTEIRNVRQLSVLSAEDLAMTASEMGLAAIDPAWVGASMILKGIPDFTHVPPSSRLQAPGGATLVIDMENRPCVLPGREIEQEHSGFGAKYKAAATGRRGVTAWVEREGAIAVGEVLTLHIPDQPVWSAFHQARESA